MRTVARMWQEAVVASRSYPPFLFEKHGRWHELSWAEAAEAVDEVSAGFLALGIQRGDRVAILARTRLEWSLCDYALASLGAVTVPIYPTSSTLECAYVIGSSGARAVVCEHEEHLATIRPVRAELAALDHVVSMEPGCQGALGLAELRENGRALIARSPTAVSDARAAIGEDDLLTILYTSGTTGPPKGCMLTQRHFRAMVEMIGAVPGLFAGEDRVLLFLPLAHNFARLVQYAGAGVGFTIAFCSDAADIPGALGAVRPTIFPSVPRLFEKLHASISTAFSEASGVRRVLVERALAAGRRRSALERSGRPLPAPLRLELGIADRLVFARVKERLGGRLRIAVSGGAPLSKEIAEFFHALGILVLEGYGLTECTTASHVNRPAAFRFGTVGQLIPGVEGRLADDGELELRGENVFAGYWGDDRSTREAFTSDGWLRTGDVGSIDEDGFLTITDRKKDIIITAGGKNVSPLAIEASIKSGTPLVSQVLVVGDRRPYVTALLTVDPDEAARGGLEADALRSALEAAVDRANQQLARPQQVKRFAILPRDFSAEEGEITPTLKLRRRVCEEHFRAEIDALYP